MGRGSTGRGVEHPPPLSPASLVERYSPTTPTARPLPRPPPAPSRGRAVWDDSPGYSARGSGNGISVRVIALTAERLSVPGSVSTGYRPVGEGLTGRGVEHPPPLSPVSLVERYSPTTPTARPLPRPPPAPSRGRAVWDDSPDTVHGGMNGISVRVIALTAGEVVCSWQCVYGISPPWGRGSTGRGVEHPPPLSPASLVERYSPTTPTARPLRGLLPPPQGGGQYGMIARIRCTGG